MSVARTTKKSHEDSLSAANGTREKLLRAALHVFAEKGFSGATTREIANRAEVFQPQIAYFFSSKLALWKEIVESVIPLSNAMLDLLLEDRGQDSKTRIARLVRNYLTFAAQHPEWIGIVIRGGLTNDETSDWLITKYLRPRSEKIYRAMTGRSLAQAGAAEARVALSVLSILSGAIATFPQAAYAQGIAEVEVDSHAFLEDHIRLVTAAINAVIEVS
jgi:AcrR family transcriptional regulator